MDRKSSAKNPRVDVFLSKEARWQPEYEALRNIVLDSGLSEELKWGQPCYTCEGKNIVLIHGFKEYFALLFMKGALMKDPKGILIQQTRNVQSGRQIRFTSVQEIIKVKPILKAYIKEAIRVEAAGLKISHKATAEFEVAEEFQKKLEKSAALRKAFASLTPGRQRAYLLYFSAPKQSKTREFRIEKCIPQIMRGRGLLDQ